MPVTSYHTINGRIRAESTGGARTGYLPDALGSVTATVDEAGAIVNTYRFKPYGAQLSKTGGGADPEFSWVGMNGYRKAIDDQLYVRNRAYAVNSANWLSKDRTWPNQKAYLYLNSEPISGFDYNGLQAAPRIMPAASSNRLNLRLDGGCCRPNPWLYSPVRTTPPVSPWGSQLPYPFPSEFSVHPDPAVLNGVGIGIIVRGLYDLIVGADPAPKAARELTCIRPHFDLLLLYQKGSRYSDEECKNLYDSMHNTCDRIPSNPCRIGDDCTKIKGMVQGLMRCISMRSDIVEHCEYTRPDWKPNPCMHMARICLLFSWMDTCRIAGLTCFDATVSFNFDNQKHLCAKAMAWCKGQTTFKNKGSWPEDWIRELVK